MLQTDCASVSFAYGTNSGFDAYDAKNGFRLLRDADCKPKTGKQPELAEMHHDRIKAYYSEYWARLVSEGGRLTSRTL